MVTATDRKENASRGAVFDRRRLQRSAVRDVCVLAAGLPSRTVSALKRLPRPPWPSKRLAARSDSGWSIVSAYLGIFRSRPPGIAELGPCALAAGPVPDCCPQDPAPIRRAVPRAGRAARSKAAPATAVRPMSAAIPDEMQVPRLRADTRRR